MARKTKSQIIFETELLIHMEALKTFAFHLTYNEDDADDLVQETYMKAHRSIDNYIEGTNAKAWLFKILKNSYINEYRKRVKQPIQVNLEDVTSLKSSDESKNQTYEDLREEIFDYSMGDEVTMAMMSLPEEFREVILMCDIENFSYEEIAKTIELPIGTVRSRLFRARNMLKEKLKKYALDLGYRDMRGQNKIKNSIQEEE
ncbi:MAG TPA: sigma-70 family RNA polymerase sigma factor [Saprospiraceae bacterium]|nr:sigma-70 family RNA polymerase sigma factor [Saprospiraceae bacterium]HRO07381.1 sigma-70 family RNA polymerase sigma factor [Saprospiraceae bacterium]HRP40664.1 sigma-70 family RNA polymerase sigma factor [Saprospiraceae bacterium]